MSNKTKRFRTEPARNQRLTKVGTTTQKLVVLAASPSIEGGDEPGAQNQEPPTDPVALYRLERDRRHRRLAFASELTEAKRDFAALLQREREAGKGGRPKGSKAANPLAGNLSKPWKPMILAVREDPRDVLWQSLGHYGGEG